MKSIKVKYEEQSDIIEDIEGSEQESWVEVCEKFNNDVHRIRDVKDKDLYSGLYECFDADNKLSHYIVEEDNELKRLKHKNFYKSLGI